MAMREPRGNRAAKPGVTRVKKDAGSDDSRHQGELTAELAARVAERAYALYEQRGRADGHDLDDWLEAERQVLSEMAKRR